MSSSGEESNRELERLIAAARPALQPASQNRLSYEAGLSVGATRMKATSSGIVCNAWTLLATHVGAIAAAVLVLLWMEPKTLSAPIELAVEGTVQSDLKNDLPHPVVPLAEQERGVITARTRPEVFVEFLSRRSSDPMPDSLAPLDEPVLNPRSFVY